MGTPARCTYHPWVIQCLGAKLLRLLPFPGPNFSTLGLNPTIAFTDVRRLYRFDRHPNTALTSSAIPSPVLSAPTLEEIPAGCWYKI